MIEQKTVFILGAGSSYPYGYPTAEGLKEEIIKKCQGYKHLIQYLLDIGLSRDDLHSFQKSFDDSQARMIDYYLADNNSEKNILIGKAAIAVVLLESEVKNSVKLNIDVQDNWISIILEGMTSDISKNNFDKEFLKMKLAFYHLIMIDF